MGRTATAGRFFGTKRGMLNRTVSTLAVAVIATGTANATEAPEAPDGAAPVAVQGAAQATNSPDQAQPSNVIIVTARKRAEDIQDVPVAITALNERMIETMDIESAIDLSGIAPNLQSPKNTVSFNAPQFYIRGAGRANNNWNAENAVAVFVDDIYLQSTAAAYLDIVDFERIEVLRGPQGTLYGRNATTGAIKFVPRRPELSDFRAVSEATLGSNDRLDLKGVVSAPLVEDVLGVSLSAFYTSDDGFTTLVNESNQVLDKDYASKEHYGFRIATLLQAADNLQFELNFDWTEQNDGTNLVTPIAPPDPTDLTQWLSKRGTVDFNPVFGVNRVAAQPITGPSGSIFPELQDDGGSRFEGWGLVFKAALETDFGTLKSITGYRAYEDFFISQLGGRGVPSTLFGVSLYSTVDSYNDYDQFTQELQFTGNFGDRFDYVLGAYYFQNNWFQQQYGSVIGVPSDFSAFLRPGQTQSFGGSEIFTDLDAESYALYFDASWEFIDGISVLFGVRQTWDEKTVDYDTRFEDGVTNYPGFPLTTNADFDRFTPRFGLEWEATPDILLYASYAEGYKAGNLVGDRATAPGPASTFLSPEVVKTYEAGIKAELFDSTLRLNLAGFLSDYTNKADLIDPQTVAIADVEINGIEVEVNWTPIDALNIFVNAGFLDASYKSADPNHPIFSPDPTGFAPGLDAEPVVTPGYSITAGMSYTHRFADGSDLSYTATIQAVDDHFNGLGVSNFDSERVAAYEVVDMSLRYDFGDPGVSVTLGVSNVFDKAYYTTGFFGSIPEFAGRYYSDGRAWRLGLRYEY